MLLTSNYVFLQMIVHFIVAFFFVFGVISLAVGVGLVASGATMQRLFGAMNRWISTRRVMRWASIPRDTEHALHRHRGWFGVALVAGGAFGLAAGFDVGGLVNALGKGVSPPLIGTVADSVKWFLVIGNTVAIAVGIMFIFFPHALSLVEAQANRWYSFRRLGDQGDTMHLTLDKWVEASPRTAGWLITAAALFVVIDYGIVLFTRF